MAQKHAEIAKGYYSGAQTTEKVGISRTTSGRSLKKSELLSPKKSTSVMLLFELGVIDSLLEVLELTDKIKA